MSPAQQDDPALPQSLTGVTISELGPKFVGHWYLKHGEIKVSTKAKPSVWTRFWMKLFFGIQWIEGAI